MRSRRGVVGVLCVLLVASVVAGASTADGQVPVVETEPEAGRDPVAWARWAEARIVAADRAVFARYARWLPRVRVRDLGGPQLQALLGPLVAAPDDPARRMLEQRLFGDRRRPWLAYYEDGSAPLLVLTSTRLLRALPLLRARIADGLRDSRVVGAIDHVTGTYAHNTTPREYAARRQAEDGVPPAQGRIEPMRLADAYGSLLGPGNRPGAPTFPATGTLAERNAGLEALLRWLDAFGTATTR